MVLPRSSLRSLVVAALLVLLIGGRSSPLAAQSADDGAALQARVEALQQQLRALRAEAAKGATTGIEGTVAALEQRVEELSTQLRILARQAELEKEQATERARQVSQPTAGRSGFSVQSADGNFRLRLRGYVHSDGRFFLADSEQRGVDTFVLRRVRPIVEATMYGLFDVRIMPDFGGGTTVLQDAYIDARLSPRFKIRAGKFKPPFGFERLMSATEIPFIERAFPTSLVPNRDVGMMVHGDVAGGNLAYAAGVFNGVPDGGSADQDIQDGKEAVARLFAQPFRARRDSAWQGLGAGMAVSYGDQRGVSAASSGLPVFRTAGQTPFFAFRGDDPILGPVLADGIRARVSFQGHYYVRSYGLFAEQVRSSQKVRRGTAGATLDSSSWQVGVSWVVTGETPSYRGVTPRAPFDMKAGTFGSVELTARYSELHLDRDAFPVFANPAASTRGAAAWAVGANWMLNSGIKLQVNYERTRFTVAGAAERRPENDLLTRVQFSF